MLMITVLLFVATEGALDRHAALCIHNCAQCKRTFGPFFEGQRCAEWCMQVSDSTLPDCSDLDSIADFITK
ncbi:Eclosion hormone, partial [Stegodyphus mimosarum]